MKIGPPGALLKVVTKKRGATKAGTTIITIAPLPRSGLTAGPPGARARPNRRLRKDVDDERREDRRRGRDRDSRRSASLGSDRAPPGARPTVNTMRRKGIRTFAKIAPLTAARRPGPAGDLQGGPSSAAMRTNETRRNEKSLCSPYRVARLRHALPRVTCYRSSTVPSVLNLHKSAAGSAFLSTLAHAGPRQYHSIPVIAPLPIPSWMDNGTGLAIRVPAARPSVYRGLNPHAPQTNLQSNRCVRKEDLYGVAICWADRC
ncbi:hypothetical protein BDK51DRAFT_42722 [Blyttiomyces helicus]|uniref:Uncharacterized protein n=1 Tax=Blyttiomyces helicus TaxID=388810 RepID=A0A4V1IR69_9FUNG|nr:hypothetical protein BDK51DRAFT_42722 [Blyttiomyces helicus]|eukprot:RKO89017.1 hypothetical protein BDK51DRAFT_42722 [Blyttiomyces helicus]